jgi:hypothetical protein
MLHMPILSGRLGKWAYGLVEYDLIYESLNLLKAKLLLILLLNIGLT